VRDEMFLASLKRAGILLIILNCIYESGYSSVLRGKVCFEKDGCFYVQLAISEKERAYGLMDKKYLSPKEGMLFCFREEGRYPFWMKNTFIPLDIIWINKEREIVFIKENALPCKEGDCKAIYPDKGAMYVLELNAGVSRKIGLKVGNKMSLYIYKSGGRKR